MYVDIDKHTFLHGKHYEALWKLLSGSAAQNKEWVYNATGGSRLSQISS